MNLLRVRREAARTREGLRVLGNKRQALMQAFLAQVSDRVRCHDRLQERTRAAAGPLVEALAAGGAAHLTSVGWAAARRFGLEVHREVVWGVSVATFRRTRLLRDFRERGFDPVTAGARVNRLADHLEEVLDLVLETAATELRMKRLGAEIRKTSRRFNALEARVLPRLEGDEKRIREALGELERDENQRLRRLKRRRARSPAAATPAAAGGRGGHPPCQGAAAQGRAQPTFANQEE